MEQPVENIKLTFEQLQAEDFSKKRLANIESEISIATRNLKILKGDTGRATKENTYHTDMLAIVSQQVADKQKASTELDEQILSQNEVFAKVNSEIATKSALQTSKDLELKAREDSVAQAELENTNNSEMILKHSNILEKDKAEFYAKVTKLKEVIKDF